MDWLRPCPRNLSQRTSVELGSCVQELLPHKRKTDAGDAVAIDRDQEAHAETCSLLP
jgi:hypothetical protein